MARPIKALESGALQELLSTEEDYLAYLAGVHLGKMDNEDLSALSVNPNATLIGTYEDTFYPEGLGAIPGETFERSVGVTHVSNIESSTHTTTFGAGLSFPRSLRVGDKLRVTVNAELQSTDPGFNEIEYQMRMTGSASYAISQVTGNPTPTAIVGLQTTWEDFGEGTLIGGNFISIFEIELTNVGLINLRIDASSTDLDNAVTTSSDTIFFDTIIVEEQEPPETESLLTNVYQNDFNVADVDVKNRPLKKNPVVWDRDANAIREIGDEELEDLCEEYLKKALLNDFPGTFRLASVSPGLDWREFISNVFSDTRGDGTTIYYSIWIKTKGIVPTNTAKPLAPHRVNGKFSGLKEMTQNEVEFSFGELMKKKIMETGLGTYQLRSSVEGPPTAPGEWVPKGTATDTTLTFRRSFSYVDTDTYNLDYITQYASSFESDYTGEYIPESDEYLNAYEPTYDVSFIGNYEATYEDIELIDYVQTFDIDYISQYVQDFTADYSGDYIPSYNDYNPIDYYTTSYTGFRTYVRGGFYNAESFAATYTSGSGSYSGRTYTRTYVYLPFYRYFSSYRPFSNDYIDVNTNEYTTIYEDEETLELYIGDYIGNNYAGTYTEFYSGDFAQPYVQDLEIEYSGDYVSQYEKVRLELFSDNYDVEVYEDVITRVYTGTYDAILFEAYTDLYEASYDSNYQDEYSTDKQFISQYEQDYIGADAYLGPESEIGYAPDIDYGTNYEGVIFSQVENYESGYVGGETSTFVSFAENTYIDTYESTDYTGFGVSEPISLTPSNLAVNSLFGESVSVYGGLVAVGCVGNDREGEVFVYEASTGEDLYTVYSPSLTDTADFGAAIAISDNYLVVGAPRIDYDTYTRESGRVYVYESATGSFLYSIENPTPVENENFGSAVAVSGNYAIIGHGEYDWRRSGAYIYDLTTGNLLHTLVDPSPGTAEYFGFSVAISGNYAIVSAYADDDKGSVYVYDVTSGELLRTIISPTTNQDRFGYSVAISGNYAIVGAYYEDTGAFNTGSAYIYDVTNGQLVHTLNNPTPANNENFGFSVAISSDYAIVGAQRETTGGSNSGSAYIYDVATGNLIYTLNNPQPLDNSFFGFSVAISNEHAAVGAIESSTYIPSSGQAYVYRLSNTTNYTVAYEESNYETQDYLGPGFAESYESLALELTALPPIYSPNLQSGYLSEGPALAIDGDNIIVGERRYDQDAYIDFSGRAYIFSYSTGELLQTLENPIPNSSDYFGYDVAISGNYAVVGAYFDDTDAANSGSAYVFNVSTGQLIHTLANPSPDNSEYFGRGVAISGNYIAIGAYGYDDILGSSAGVVYIYDAISGSLIRTIYNPAQDGATADDRFGSKIALSGNNLIVGTARDDGDITDGGIAYIYDVTNGNLLYTLNNPQNPPLENADFGGVVAISDNYAAVGATGGQFVSIYDLSTGSLLNTLPNPETSFSWFPSSISMTDNYVIVGDYQIPNEFGEGNSGVVYIYDTKTGVLLQSIDNPNVYSTSVNDTFGYAVAISDDRIVVSAFSEDHPLASDTGVLYRFSYTTPQQQTVFDTVYTGGNPYEGSFARSIYFNNYVGIRQYAVDYNSAYTGDYAQYSGLYGGTDYSGPVWYAENSYVSNIYQPEYVSDEYVSQYAGTLGYVAESYESDAATITLANSFTDQVSNNNYGQSVATDGKYIAVGANLDDDPDSNAGKVYVYDVTTDTLVHTITNPDPTGTSNDQFGYSLSISGDNLLIGAPYSSGKAYIFSLDTGNLVRTITQSGTLRFGWSVSINGNYAIVADDDNSTGGTDAGAVYVYDVSTGNLLHTLYNPKAPSGRFGFSISSSGNYLIVGAPYNDINSYLPSDEGIVYIYDLTTGNLLHRIENPDPAYDAFGYSVALDGNYAAVGSYFKRAVYVYNVITGELVQTVSNTTETFGLQVALSGNNLLVGSRNVDYDSYEFDAGEVYLYDITTGNLLATIENPNAYAKPHQDYFGNAISITNDKIVATALGEDSPTGLTTGRVYVFNYLVTGSETVSFDSSYVPSYEISFVGDYQGIANYIAASYTSDAATVTKTRDIVQKATAIAIDGDNVIVGDTNYEPEGDTYIDDSGVAYIYSYSTGEILHTLENPTPSSQDYFGVSVAISGNYAVVGSRQDFTGSVRTGRVYVYNVTTGQLLYSLDNPTSTETNFGISVSVSDDYLVVGANFYGDALGSQSGIVYVYDTASGNLLHTLYNPGIDGNTTGELFGGLVGVSGNYIIVGANEVNSPVGERIGSLYVFDATTGTLLHNLKNPTGVDSDWFATAIAISGNYAIVGAYQEDTGAGNAGSAYIYNVATGELLHTLNNPNPFLNDYFGISVAISGNYAVVGADRNDVDSYELDSGEAYLYDVISGQLLAVIENPNTYSTQQGDNFGRAVAISGNNLVVYANNEDSPIGLNVGLLYFYQVQASETPGITSYDIGYVPSYDNPDSNEYVTDSSYIGESYVADPSVNPQLVHTLENPANASTYFGFQSDTDGTYIIVSGYGEDSSAGKVYIYNASTGNIVHTLTSPTPTANADFGISVAIEGNLAAVGENKTDNSGVIHLYNVTTGARTYTIDNPNPSSEDYFGYSVAISGNNVLVGAYGEDDAFGTSSGAAYLFDGSSATLLKTFNNPAPDGESVGDRFGYNVDINGNNSIISTFDVNTSGATFSTYVYNNTTGSLLHAITFSSRPGAEVAINEKYFALESPSGVSVYNISNGQLVHEFAVGATSLSLDGDYLVIGDADDDTTGTNSGIVYVYDLINGTLISTLYNPNNYSTTDQDDFGRSVSLKNSVLVVGADGEDSPLASPVGIYYVYNLNAVEAGSYVDTPYDQSYNEFYETDYLGAQVYSTFVDYTSYATNYTGDYLTDYQALYEAELFVTYDGAIYAGEFERQYVQEARYVGDFSAFYESDYIKDYAVVLDSATQIDNVEGHDSAINENYLITVSYDSITLFDRKTGVLVHQENIPVTSGSTYSNHVAVDQNLLLVSNAFSDTAWVYTIGSDGSLTLDRTITSPDTPTTFGADIAVDQRYAVITEQENSVTNVSSVYVFDVQTGGFIRRIDIPSGQAGVFITGPFYKRLAIEGDYLVVGEQSYDGEFTDQGRVYIYDLLTGILQNTVENPDPQAYSRFGSSVDVSDGTIIAAGRKAHTIDLVTGVVNKSFLNYYSDIYRHLSVAIDGEYAIIGDPYRQYVYGDAFLRITKYHGRAALFDILTGAKLYDFASSHGSSLPNTYTGAYVSYYNGYASIAYNVTGVEVSLYRINVASVDYATDYASDYQDDYSGAYIEEFYTGDYLSDYVNINQTIYGGNYSAEYVGDDYLGEYASVYLGDYEKDYTGNFLENYVQEQYTGDFLLDDLANYEGAFVGEYSTDYGIDYLVEYVDQYTGNYNSIFEGQYNTDYDQTYIGNDTVNYNEQEYSGDFASIYVQDYESSFQGQYTGDRGVDYQAAYLTPYNFDYLSNYSADYTTVYVTPYESEYNEPYLRDYTDEYLKEYVKDEPEQYSTDYLQRYTSDVYIGDFILNYETPYQVTYTGNYSSLYVSDTYVGNYLISYDGLSYEGNYSNPYTGDYIDRYTAAYVNDYATQSYVPTYSSNYTGSFVNPTLYASVYEVDYTDSLYTGNVSITYISSDYLGNYNSDYTPTYVGNYVPTYVGSYNSLAESSYEGNYTGNFSQTFLAIYTGDYAATYDTSFTRDYESVDQDIFQGQYVHVAQELYVGTFEGTYDGLYTGNYTGQFQSTSEVTSAETYTGNYPTNYDGLYTGNYTGQFQSTSQVTSSEFYTGDFVAQYEGSSLLSGWFIEYEPVDERSTYYWEIRDNNFNFIAGGTRTGTHALGQLIYTYNGQPIYRGDQQGGLIYNVWGTSNGSADYEASASIAYTGEYTGNFSSLVDKSDLQQYTGNYEGIDQIQYTGEYTGNFSSLVDKTDLAQYTGDYSRIREVNYTGDYETTYIQANYLGDYVGVYQGVGSAFYTGEYSGDYVERGYTSEKTITDLQYYGGTVGGVYDGGYDGGSGDIAFYDGGDYTSTGLEQFVGEYVSDFAKNFVGIYSGTYESAYQENVAKTYTGDYEAPGYIGNYLGDYNTVYSTSYQADYIGTDIEIYIETYDTSYASDYIGYYTGEYNSVYTVNYTTDYADAISLPYEGRYVTEYTDFYEGNYAGDYQALYAHDYEALYESKSIVLYVGEYSKDYTEQDYTGNYETSYVDVYLTEYQTDYSKTYIQSDYTGAYVEAYTGEFISSYLANYIGDYEHPFEGDYEATYIQDLYSGTYVEDYSGDYQTNYIFDYNTTYVQAEYTGLYEAAYTGNFTEVFEGQYTGDFLAQYSTPYTVPYIGNYEGAYSPDYVQDVIELYTGEYETVYEGNYERTYTSDYVGDYSTLYTGEYEIDYVGGLKVYASSYVTPYSSEPYEVQYEESYLGEYVGNYTPTYQTTYTANYIGTYDAVPYIEDYEASYIEGTYESKFTETYIEDIYIGDVASNYDGGIYSQEYLRGYQSNIYEISYSGEFTSEPILETYVGDYNEVLYETEYIEDIEVDTAYIDDARLISTPTTIETFTLYMRVA